MPSQKILRSAVLFFGLGTIAQAINAISGFLIIRILTVEDYGIYFTALSFMSAAQVICESGTLSAMSAIGARVHTDSLKLYSLFSDAKRITTRRFPLAVLCSLPFVPGLIVVPDVRFDYATAIFSACLLNAYLTLRVILHAAESRVLLKSEFIARNQLFGAAIRFALIFPVFLTGSSGVFILLILNAVSLALQIHHFKINTEKNQRGCSARYFENDIKIISNKQLPNSLYAVYSANVYIILLSTLGSATHIAEFGALGRIAVISVVGLAFVRDFVGPRFARIDKAAEVGAFYIKTALIISFATMIICVIAMLYPAAFLIIIGEKYDHLNEELWIALAGAGAGFLASTIFSYNMARGWVIDGRITVITGVASFGILAFIFDVGSVQGALMVSLISSVLSALISSAFAAIKISKLQLMN